MASQAATKGSPRLGRYLRRLRSGYGYTLRRVEEKAQALGDPIDNSQLSRFEKGKATPSFDKLRTLAKVFSIPVQQFSDILDLEQFDRLKPSSRDGEFLMEEGKREFKSGSFGRAFVIFERALEVVERPGEAASRSCDEREAEARLYMAYALKALGKLGMAELELRTTLRNRRRLPRAVHLRSLTMLAQAYREQADHYLASILAREALEIASEEGDLAVQISILNTLGNIAFDEGGFADAAEHYERALRLAERVGGHAEMVAVFNVNLGGCLVSLERPSNGMARIRKGVALAKDGGFRRALALGLTRLGEAYLGQDDQQRALGYLRQSDQVANNDGEPYNDILFLNAYRVWENSRTVGNAVQERLAMGRLKYYRSLIERKFPEVEAFDSFIEGRRHSA